MQFVEEWPHDRDTELKMTAMIDVVFQLLIFFLVGTKFREPAGELEAYLPPTGAPAQLKERNINVDEIRITLLVPPGHKDPEKEPRVQLDNTMAKAGVRGGSLGWLRSELNSAVAEDPSIAASVAIIIEAEPDLAYKWVIQTLGICRGARFKTVNFAASKRNQPPETGILKKPPG